MWEVEYTDEFEVWWNQLSESAQVEVTAVAGLLEIEGPALKFPYSSGIHGSKHSHLTELRVQHLGKPLRILYAFDPRRSALLLIGGDKTGKEDWYETYIAIADRLYDEHLELLKSER